MTDEEADALDEYYTENTVIKNMIWLSYELMAHKGFYVA
jgi:hypothetical protein